MPKQPALATLRFIALFLAAVAGVTPAFAQTGHWLTGYYATYNSSVMTTSQVDYTKLTHVIYWPVIPNSGPAGSATAPGTLNATPFGLSEATFSAGATALVTGAHAAGAKALIGIGGDASSGATAGFQISTSPTYQASFISNIIALMKQYSFDGVDINWEQIQASDASDFTSFITNLRAALQTTSPNVHLLLTMAPETKPNGGQPSLLAQVYQSLDQINIQTYQMSGAYCGWETWYNSPLNNGGATFSLDPSEQLPSITNAIADYTSAGIPESKLGMGIQFDSEVWTGGQGTSTGGVTQPKQTWTGDANLAFCSATNPDAPTANTLAYRLMITTLATTAGYTTNFDSTADQSWLSFDPSGTGTTNEGKDTFVSFDSPTSIAKKGVDMSPAQAGVGGALGGVFIFELSGDYAGSTAAAAQQHPLLDAAHGMQMLLPGLVTNLTATPGTGSVTLKWTAANGAASYAVSYAASSTGPATQAPIVSATQATVMNLTAGQEYWFRVTPVNAFGSGVASPQVTATVPGLLTPTITWAKPAAIPYGTPLSATQLDATASTPGTFVYSPAKGTILPVGTTTLSVTFTPTSPAYAKATKSVSQAVILAALSTATNFGSVNVGTESNAHAITVNIPADGELSSIQVLTLGASGLDFQEANGGTCVTGVAHAAATTCTVNVTFTPTAAGTRSGAVVVVGGSFAGPHCCAANTYTYYIDGTGVGPQITFDPGTKTSLSFPFSISPRGIAIDGSGNGYFGNGNEGAGTANVIKVPPGGSSSVYVSGLLSAPEALAIDGAGNLYMTESTTVVKVTPTGAQSTVATGLVPAPKGLAVDPSDGTLYIANTVGNTVVKVTAAGVQSTFLTGKVLGKALSLPCGIAVDGSGNVYVVDNGNDRILKVPSSGTNAVLLPFTGLTSPFGMALGGTGNVYVAAAAQVLKLTPAGVQTTVLTASAIDIALDSSEDLYYDAGTALFKLNRSSDLSLVFANTKVGTASSDSPKSLTIDNFGNAALELTIPTTGKNPEITTNFTVDTSTTCPILTPASSASALAAGQACKYAVDFVPANVGASLGSLTLVDNLLNATNAEQVVSLQGTGLAGTATVTLSGLAATYTGHPISATATTSPAGLAVAITYNGSSTAPTKAGSYAVVATVTAAGFTGSASGTLAIAKAKPVVTWPTPAPIASGVALSVTQLDATANVPGSFVYSPAAGTVPAAGTDTLSTTFTPTDAVDYTTAAASVSLTVTGSAAPQRVVWVPDFFGSLLQVRVGATNPTAIKIALPGCNPNAVAVNSNKAYVVCSAFNGNPDKILVYNATTIRAAGAGTLSISPSQTITSAQFNSLIGITFDSSNNLWVASYGNSQVESISAATLNTANPVVNVNLINSPSSPVSLAFDTNGSLWVVGQFDGGILLNFPTSQLNAGANAIPDYCLATVNVGSGCQFVDNVFLNPEGVALFNGDVWVANNATGADGNVPAREIVDLKYSGGTLTVNATFGNSGVAADSPFVCPGGLFGSPAHLWVNDESYGETNPQCGAAGDVASQTGGVFSFTPAQLANKTTTISAVLAFSNITGRPGFGGIFVEND